VSYEDNLPHALNLHILAEFATRMMAVGDSGRAQ